MTLLAAILVFAFFYVRRERRERRERAFGQRILKDYVHRAVEVPESVGPRERRG